jgi:hypothetical protein
VCMGAGERLRFDVCQAAGCAAVKQPARRPLRGVLCSPPPKQHARAGLPMEMMPILTEPFLLALR